MKGTSLFKTISMAVLGTICLFGAMAQENRYALVIGNASYTGDASLKNPVNDAEDVASSLKKVGWEVILATDVDRRGFNRAVASFRDTLSSHEGATALFYYAGHGTQIDGFNYLLPVKTVFENMDDLKNDSISLNSITDAIEQGKANVSMIILDACRDNPFAKTASRSMGGANRGLSLVQNGGGSSGSAIIFSTSPGDVALDGKGRNGVFTSAFLKYLDLDLKLEDMFKKVSAQVRESTGGAQKPWINASLTSDFFLVSETIRQEHLSALQKAEEERKQLELAKASEKARAEEAQKTEAARKEADLAKKKSEETQAALLAAQKATDDANKQAALARAEQSRPKGKARFESNEKGLIYIGQDLYGEIGPDQPLIADSLNTGNLEVRFESASGTSETKSITVTDKAYVTVVFARNSVLDKARENLAAAATPSSETALDASKMRALKIQIRELVATDIANNAREISKLTAALSTEDIQELYQLNAVDNVGPFFMNWLPVSLGSFEQGDVLGGIATSTLKVGGMVALGYFMFGTTDEQKDGEYRWLFVAGAGTFLIGDLWSLISPWTYSYDHNRELKRALNISEAEIQPSFYISQDENGKPAPGIAISFSY